METNDSKNTVFVAVELYKGIVGEVRAFKSLESAEEAENKWLAEAGIEDEISRECKAGDGTEYHVFECQLED